MSASTALSIINEQIDDLQSFPDAEDHAMAAAMAEYLERLQEKRQLMASLLERLSIVGKGMTLKHRNGRLWAILLSDPSEPGRFRYQMFAADGFMGHVTKNSMEDALCAAIDDGYLTEDAGALDRLSATEEWRLGSEITNLVEKINRGVITFREGHAQIAALSQALATLRATDEARAQQPTNNAQPG